MKDLKLVITVVLFIVFAFAADYRISKLLETVRIQNNLLKQWKQRTIDNINKLLC